MSDLDRPQTRGDRIKSWVLRHEDAFILTGMCVFVVGVMTVAIKAGIAQEERMTAELNGYVDQLNALVEMSQINAL